MDFVSAGRMEGSFSNKHNSSSSDRKLIKPGNLIHHEPMVHSLSHLFVYPFDNDVNTCFKCKVFFAIPAQPELALLMLTFGSYLITKTITLDTEIVIF